jgi:hypothetical protein
MSRIASVLATNTAPYKTYHPYAIIKLGRLKRTFHKVYGPKAHHPEHNRVHGRTGEAKALHMRNPGHVEGQQE